MATYACKILTDNGELFTAYNTVIDQFICPALASVRAVSKQIEHIGPDDNTSQHTFDLRQQSLKEIARIISVLESGQPILDDEACLLYSFADFLTGTVAYQQYDYPEVTVEVWVSELDMRHHYPHGWDGADILDSAQYNSFQNAGLARKHPSAERQKKLATPQENRLAGRYITALAKIANVLGPERSSPKDIVNKFYKIMKTRSCGTQVSPFEQQIYNGQLSITERHQAARNKGYKLIRVYRGSREHKRLQSLRFWNPTTGDRFEVSV